MEKYKQNLHVSNNKVYSYDTHVATIEGSKLLVHGYWSMTTSKHVNYVAKDYGLTKVDSPVQKEEKEDNNPLRSVGAIASLAAIFCSNQEEGNDWKARMLKAGLSNYGLQMPEDWNELSEDEKEKRLNAVIELATS